MEVRSQVTEGPQVRMPAGASSHHQMAEHTPVSTPWAPGPFPRAEDSRLRSSRTLGLTELLEPGTHLLQKGKKSNIKHHRKVQPSGFYKI